MKITHIYHSGFSIELEQFFLIFDWYKGDLPSVPAGKQILVFVSHGHADHYNEQIWTLRRLHPGTKYVVDSGIPGVADAEDVCKVSAGRIYTETDVFPEEPGHSVKGICKQKSNDPRKGSYPQKTSFRIHTYKSTDQGVAFLVDIEGYRIFHAGDLNVWFWYDEPMKDNLQSEADCRAELLKLSEDLGHRPVDVAFWPLDPRLKEEAPRGLSDFMKIVDAKIVFPMHYWNRKDESEAYLDDLRLAPYRDRICFEDVREFS